LRWIDIHRIAFGEMSITPSEWENITPYYFKCRLDGMRNKEMQVYRSEMERTRWLAALILSPHGKKGVPIDPKKLSQFSWEKTSPVDVVDFVTKNKHIYDKLRL